MIWLRLWWHNNIKRHYWNWWANRYLYREWIADGRDPRFFPRSGRITRKQLNWAIRGIELRREIKGHLKAWDIEHAEVGRLRAAAELARKRLLDVVRNGDAEPEDMEAYEALDRALKDRP